MRNRSSSCVGPGLLESALEQCLAHELARNDIGFKVQHPQPVQYKGIQLDCGYRIDLLVEDVLILELNSVDKLTSSRSTIADVHETRGREDRTVDQFRRDHSKLESGDTSSDCLAFVLFASFVVKTFPLTDV